MRESCIQCVLKHLGSAAVLMDEVVQGYGLHRWLAVGHLNEAASEARMDFQGLSEDITERRREYVETGQIDIMRLIEDADEILHIITLEENREGWEGL